MPLIFAYISISAIKLPIIPDAPVIMTVLPSRAFSISLLSREMFFKREVYVLLFKRFILLLLIL